MDVHVACVRTGVLTGTQPIQVDCDTSCVVLRAANGVPLPAAIPFASVHDIEGGRQPEDHFSRWVDGAEDPLCEAANAAVQLPLAGFVGGGNAIVAVSGELEEDKGALFVACIQSAASQLFGLIEHARTAFVDEPVTWSVRVSAFTLGVAEGEPISDVLAAAAASGEEGQGVGPVGESAAGIFDDGRSVGSVSPRSQGSSRSGSGRRRVDPSASAPRRQGAPLGFGSSSPRPTTAGAEGSGGSASLAGGRAAPTSLGASGHGSPRGAGGGAAAAQALSVRHDPVFGPSVAGLWAVGVASAAEVLELLASIRGSLLHEPPAPAPARGRHSPGGAAAPEPSPRTADAAVRRSHAGLCLTLSQLRHDPGGHDSDQPPALHSRLTLLLLARASSASAGTAGCAPSIPLWVRSLSDVLTAVERQQPSVPFAASKLTQLLRDGLTGRAAAASFLAVVPNAPSVGPAVLQFAKRIADASAALAAREGAWDSGEAAAGGAGAEAAVERASPADQPEAAGTEVAGAAVEPSLLPADSAEGAAVLPPELQLLPMLPASLPGSAGPTPRSSVASLPSLPGAGFLVGLQPPPLPCDEEPFTGPVGDEGSDRGEATEVGGSHAVPLPEPQGRGTGKETAADGPPGPPGVAAAQSLPAPSQHEGRAGLSAAAAAAEGSTGQQQQPAAAAPSAIESEVSELRAMLQAQQAMMQHLLSQQQPHSSSAFAPSGFTSEAAAAAAASAAVPPAALGTAGGLPSSGGIDGSSLLVAPDASTRKEDSFSDLGSAASRVLADVGARKFARDLAHATRGAAAESPRSVAPNEGSLTLEALAAPAAARGLEPGGGQAAHVAEAAAHAEAQAAAEAALARAEAAEAAAAAAQRSADVFAATIAALRQQLSSERSAAASALSQLADEVQALQAEGESQRRALAAARRSLSDYAAYRQVVEGAMARLQGETGRLAGERDAALKRVAALQAALARERTALAQARKRAQAAEGTVDAVHALMSAAPGGAESSGAASVGGVEGAVAAEPLADGDAGSAGMLALSALAGSHLHPHSPGGASVVSHSTVGTAGTARSGLRGRPSRGPAARAGSRTPGGSVGSTRRQVSAGAASRSRASASSAAPVSASLRAAVLHETAALRARVAAARTRDGPSAELGAEEGGASGGAGAAASHAPVAHRGLPSPLPHAGPAAAPRAAPGAAGGKAAAGAASRMPGSSAAPLSAASSPAGSPQTQGRRAASASGVASRARGGGAAPGAAPSAASLPGAAPSSLVQWDTFAAAMRGYPDLPQQPQPPSSAAPQAPTPPSPYAASTSAAAAAAAAAPPSMQQVFAAAGPSRVSTSGLAAPLAVRSSHPSGAAAFASGAGVAAVGGARQAPMSVPQQRPSSRGGPLGSSGPGDLPASGGSSGDAYSALGSRLAPPDSASVSKRAAAAPRPPAASSTTRAQPHARSAADALQATGSVGGLGTNSALRQAEALNPAPAAAVTAAPPDTAAEATRSPERESLPLTLDQLLASLGVAAEGEPEGADGLGPSAAHSSAAGSDRRHGRDDTAALLEAVESMSAQVQAAVGRVSSAAPFPRRSVGGLGPETPVGPPPAAPARGVAAAAAGGGAPLRPGTRPPTGLPAPPLRPYTSGDTAGAQARPRGALPSGSGAKGGLGPRVPPAARRV